MASGGDFVSRVHKQVVAPLCFEIFLLISLVEKTKSAH